MSVKIQNGNADMSILHIPWYKIDYKIPFNVMGSDAPPKALYTVKHRLVDPNSTCLPVQAHKRSADTTVGIVAVDVSANDTGRVAQTSAVKAKERRAMKSTPKNKKKRC